MPYTTRQEVMSWDMRGITFVMIVAVVLGMIPITYAAMVIAVATTTIVAITIVMYVVAIATIIILIAMHCAVNVIAARKMIAANVVICMMT